ncbi:MAG: serine--tRNA ligase [Candidatus Aenigmatarchaeota archaeon]|nr:MAG: serine--tRNA ligase [Candidatus Aenigmarchaeota archaeon]
MLDIKLFRENPEKIKKSEKDRFKDVSVVDKVIDFDKRWRERLDEIQKLKHEKNQISEEIGLLKRAKKDAEDLIVKASKTDDEISKLEREVQFLKEERETYRYKIGNILDKSVPVAPTEEDNITVRTFGEQKEFEFTPKGHAELVERFAELERAARISGARTYYLKGDLVLLNLALIDFGIKSLIKKGFLPVQTPFFINKKHMKAAAELADFEETLYKLEGEDSYLIATSEQSIASLHSEEILGEETLPLKYAGYSTCFRKEAGSHGKDTKGIFRVHQFEKIEQFIFSNPKDSWKLFEELINNTEEIYQALELPYRIVNIASGELNDNAAKKYDLEAWFPAQKKYRELGSCSNCTGFQAAKLNVKFGKHGGNKELVHTLNSTAIATERTIACILENYQQEDGSIIVPKVLRAFVGKEVIK